MTSPDKENNSADFTHYINQIRPEIEAVLVGLLLAVADTLIALTTSGTVLTWQTLLVTALGAGLSYLTSYYRKKRGDVAIDTVNDLRAESSLVPVSDKQVLEGKGSDANV